MAGFVGVSLLTTVGEVVILTWIVSVGSSNTCIGHVHIHLWHL